ncbi:MAG: hypothetical protein P8X60_05265 [Robiginitalea sp.]
MDRKVDAAQVASVSAVFRTSLGSITCPGSLGIISALSSAR